MKKVTLLLGAALIALFAAFAPAKDANAFWWPFSGWGGPWGGGPWGGYPHYGGPWGYGGYPYYGGYPHWGGYPYYGYGYPHWGVPYAPAAPAQPKAESGSK